MKYTKMMTITTKPVFMGYKMVHAFTIKENEQPEKIIAKLMHQYTNRVLKLIFRKTLVYSNR